MPPAYRHTHWRPLRAARPPRAVRAWLGKQGSLTAALRQCCPAAIHVEILRHQVVTPTPQARRQLKMRPGERALLRETILHCGHDRPWVFAQTLIPLKHLEGGLRPLKHLSDRPIGDLLFRPGHQAVRSTIVVAPNPEKRPDMGLNSALWARRSTLWQGSGGILITEIFLSDLIHMTCSPN